MHVSPKANGLDNIHENNLKECLNKEVKAKKEAQKKQKKAKVAMKQIKDWVLKYVAKGKLLIVSWIQNIYFHVVFLFCCISHHVFILWFWNLCSLLGAKMINKNYWKCTICNFNGTFGVVDIIGHHVKATTHVLVKKIG